MQLHKTFDTKTAYRITCVQVDRTIQYAQIHEVETKIASQVATKRMRRVFTFRVRSNKDEADGRRTQRNADAAVRAREKQREEGEALHCFSPEEAST